MLGRFVFQENLTEYIMADLRLIENYGHHRHAKPIEQRRRDTQAQLARYVADTETRPIYNTDYEDSGWDEDEIQPYMNDTPMRARQHRNERGEIRYEDIWHYIRIHGIWVSCEVRWLLTMEHHHDPDNHLLAIVVKPLPQNRTVLANLFPTTRPINPWSPYHVSICNGRDNVNDRDIKYLVHKFHGEHFHLKIRNEAWRSMGSLLLDPETDPIASDPVVRRLWRNGSQGHKNGLHISI